MLKKPHLEPRNSSVCWSCSAGGLGLPSLIIPGVSGEASGTQDSLSNSYFAQLYFLSLRGWVSPWGKAGLWKELCSSSFPTFLWSNKLSASSLGQCNTMIQGQQALRGEPKKLWAGDHWEKKPALKASPQFSETEDSSEAMKKYTAGKKSQKTWNRKAHFKKLFVFYETICIKISLKKKKVIWVFLTCFSICYSQYFYIWWSQQTGIHCASSTSFLFIFISYPLRLTSGMDNINIPWMLQDQINSTHIHTYTHTLAGCTNFPIARKVMAELLHFWVVTNENELPLWPFVSQHYKPNLYNSGVFSG